MRSILIHSVVTHQIPGTFIFISFFVRMRFFSIPVVLGIAFVQFISAKEASVLGFGNAVSSVEDGDTEYESVMMDPIDEVEEDDEMTFQRLSRNAGQTCVEEHNAIRRRHGKPPFQYDSRLAHASARHNHAMTSQNCFSHQCKGEASFGDRITQAGYRWGGVSENIFAGGASCQEAVNGWMNSSGHKQNILSDKRNVGCAVQQCQGCSYRFYWTCNFASPR